MVARQWSDMPHPVGMTLVHTGTRDGCRHGHSDQTRNATRPRARTSGWLTFASIYLAIAGLINAIWGITALAPRRRYFRRRAGSSGPACIWGWIALIIAAVQILGGALIYTHKVGGMIMGIVAGDVRHAAELHVDRRLPGLVERGDRAAACSCCGP